MPTLSRLTVIAALVGGAAWAAKAIVITTLDSSFEPLETGVFLLGLIGLTIAAFSLAHDLSSGFAGIQRLLATVVGGLVVVGLGLGVTSVGDRISAALYDGTNQGIVMESGIFLLGLCWLALALTGLARRAQVVDRYSAVPAAPS